MSETQRSAQPWLPGWDCHVHVFDGQAPVRAGHYSPAHRPLSEIEALAATAGVGRLVLVQPSVYGCDHRVLLQALAQEPGRHRGVAAADAQASDAELDRLHAAGVRGVRFNLVSPVGHAGDPAADLLRLAPRLRERGWHVQWYVPAARLPQVHAWQEATGLVFVLDHLAGLHPALAPDDPAWSAAQALAAAGAWVKLSGWYRLGASSPYGTLVPAVRRLAGWFGPHLVWGSDWPHTGLALPAVPDYETTRAPAAQAWGGRLPDAVLIHGPHVLYGH